VPIKTSLNSIVRGKITHIAFGGDGILRHEGLVIFVPFTAIGDEITCQILKVKKKFAYAQLLQVLQKSPDRIEPRCPYFGTCGGCQLQHLTYNAQLEHKSQSVSDSLKRLADLPLSSISPIVSTEFQWAYRRHVTLTLKSNFEGALSLGYIGTDKRSLIEITHCPIFQESYDPIILQVRDFAHKLKCPHGSEGKVVILKNESEGKYILSFHFQHLPYQAVKLTRDTLNLYSNWAGIILKAPGFFQSFGIFISQFTIDKLSISFSSEAFVQNHPEQSKKIYKAIREMAKKSEGNILDLYCGIGITSLMMAENQRKVIGVESNAEAIKLARQNALNNHVDSVTFIQADVKNVVAKLIKKHSPNLIVINPPRIGIEKDVLQALVTSKSKELFYISCMPPTLSRDLKHLCAENYEVVCCQSYDMFPQTAHVETLVHLELKVSK
jgi:23S rRNA (uracil1939-C5)-methyltransferase